MDALADLAPYWWWLIAGVALAIAELVAPGFFLIWLGAAAVLTGLATLLLGLPPVAQSVLFAAIAIAAVYAARRWFRSNPILTSDPLLNDRAGRLVGQQVRVVEALTNGEGRVRVGDGVWTARGPDAAAGGWVRVTGADGAVLIVEPV